MDRVISMQSLGASGALHMGAKFLKDHYGPWTVGREAQVFIPAESWSNHPNVFEYLGIKVSPIPYLDNKSKMFDYNAFRATIGSIPHGSVLVLQNAAQNPTGCDPTSEQWYEIASLCRERGHLVLFDVAYPGFASGDVDTDLQSVRTFAKMEVPLILATTYGKCFGLYCERVGALFVVAPDEVVGKRIEKQMKFLARAETGAQPDFGSLIVETILSNAELRSLWQSELRDMAEQLKGRRQRLRRTLEDLKTPGIWSHITLQNGMFSYIGFTGEQIRLLREDYHVYLQDNGRVSIAGLNSSNLEHVARSIHAVITATK
ncbi:Aminotransferase class I and II [Aspergillus parasiticus SU-1]|uniref:Aminotransferase class I and II n=1 Tax=Aspergillus parasiticus (strain ATCC 56775 / NRRL 5862 / SRRC 143 / SU-1) TaxID=1403190 RepID=A0A0F0I513_ASPPU|nr:Aminotransferase class I and II [Aspergillus parasiticus SU-1]